MGLSGDQLTQPNSGPLQKLHDGVAPPLSWSTKRKCLTYILAPTQEIGDFYVNGQLYPCVLYVYYLDAIWAMCLTNLVQIV